MFSYCEIGLPCLIAIQCSSKIREKVHCGGSCTVYLKSTIFDFFLTECYLRKFFKKSIDFVFRSENNFLKNVVIYRWKNGIHIYMCVNILLKKYPNCKCDICVIYIRTCIFDKVIFILFFCNIYIVQFLIPGWSGQN